MLQDLSSPTLSDQDKRHHLHPITNPVAFADNGPDMITRAEGVYLYTSDGRRIMDIGSGLGNVNIGYGNPRVCEAAYAAMKQMSFGHTLDGRSNPWVAALGAKLTEITPEQYEYFFFASTGSDSVESAAKFALRYWRLQDRPEKRVLVGRRSSYHGGTLVAASLTGNEMFHNQFGLPISDTIRHVESPLWYRDGNGRSKAEFCRDVVRELEEQLVAIGPESIAAFIAGPNQGEPPEGYWPEVRRICDRLEILLIADEVITGFGKTGRMFAFETFGFEPDLFTMAKGLSSGYFPISSVGLGAKVADAFRAADEILAHVFTNSGHPVAAAVALENLAIIEEHGLVDRVREEIGPYFRQRLDELQKLPCVGDISSVGILAQLDIDLSDGERATSPEENAAFYDRVIENAWRKGVVTHRGSLCLPMTITQEEIDVAFGILEESFAEALADAPA